MRPARALISIPAWLDSRTKSKKHKPMTFYDIINFIDDVNDASDRLSELIDAMTAPEPSPESSAEQGGDH
jgi:hypothetical protein